MPTFRPLDDQVLVRRPDAPDMQGKLHVPERAKERPLTGEVLAVGPGHLQPDGSRQPMQVRPGEVVLFAKYSGTDVELDGVPCLVLRESELLGVIEADPPALTPDLDEAELSARGREAVARQKPSRW